MGDVTFPCTRLVDGSSSGRKLILIEVRRHVSLESQIIVESQFAAKVQAVILGLDDGCKRVLRLLGCIVERVGEKCARKTTFTLLLA